jgi:glycine betaine/proline transport system ATP-binding protein
VDGREAGGPPVPGNATLHEIARQLVADTRLLIPVAASDGRLLGLLDRDRALDLLLGPETAPAPPAARTTA